MFCRLFITYSIVWLSTCAIILAAELAVEITGLINDEGQCLVSLYSGENGFPSEHERAMQSRVVKAAAAGVLVTFTNLPPGEYALSVCHDENSNGRMDTRSFGRPQEGYGLYLPQESRLGPPVFSRSVFKVGTNDMKVAVKMVYPEK